MNTRGQGLVPAKLRAKGNKGSLKKEKHTAVQLIMADRDAKYQRHLERKEKAEEKQRT